MPELIDTAAIAKLIGLSHDTVRDRVVHRPDFPRPAIALNTRVRRWSRESVEEVAARL